VTTAPRTRFEGHYYDGRTAGRRRVAVTISRAGLDLAPEAGPSFFWPYQEIRQAQGANPGEPIRLERGGDLPEVLVVADPAFPAALAAIAPETRRQVRAARPPGARLALALGAAVGALAAGAAVYVWVIPPAAEAVAERVPIAWEEEVGRRVTEDGLLGAARRCEDPAGAAALDKVVRTLLAASPGGGYTYRVRVIDHPMINAFAAPGGYVTVMRGLVRLAETPEELAGVLAHEFQHVERRHTTKRIVRDASAGVLLAAATGDATQFAQVLGAAEMFGELHFSREAEREADARGMATVQAARVDPAGMASFMRKLDDLHDRDESGAFRYLSTHPVTAERVAELERLAREATYQPVTLLSPEEWRALKAICGPEPANTTPALPEASPAGR
jgi:beta-barrel assembly-enhancing protease